MFLYIVFFNQNQLESGVFSIRSEYLDHVIEKFPLYKELDQHKVKACIGVLKGKENQSKKCVLLRAEPLKATLEYCKIKFNVEKELEIKNSDIDKSLYRHAKTNDLMHKDKPYYPALWILDKNEFDEIRKNRTSARKMTSQMAAVEEHRSKNDWSSICNMFEPLEKLEENSSLWNNAADLYDIGFACSKMGEPQNGKEKDKEHLKIVKKYRDLSQKIYERCYEIDRRNFSYASAMAYRHYQNVNELTKPKGRRDGNVAEEIEKALMWYERSLEIYPKSIKDNYRKGKLILEKWCDNYTFSQRRDWNRDDFEVIEKMEREAEKCLHLVIEEYESLTDEEKRKRNRREYSKSLYQLGKYHSSKFKLPINEYICAKLTRNQFKFSVDKNEKEHIVKARDFFEKCYEIEAGEPISTELSSKSLVESSRKWALEPMDMLHQIGNVYLTMFFIKREKNTQDPKVQEYGHKTETYLGLSIEMFNELRRRNIGRRHSAHVDNLLAQYYLLTGNYEKAISIVERSREGYVKNTYAAAIMLENKSDKVYQAENVLLDLIQDKYNKAKNTSKVMLGVYYKITGKDEELLKLSDRQFGDLSKNGKKLLKIASIGDAHEN